MHEITEATVAKAKTDHELALSNALEVHASRERFATESIAPTISVTRKAELAQKIARLDAEGCLLFTQAENLRKTYVVMKGFLPVAEATGVTQKDARQIRLPKLPTFNGKGGPPENYCDP
jgi:hypothetical protein